MTEDKLEKRLLARALDGPPPDRSPLRGIAMMLAIALAGAAGIHVLTHHVDKARAERRQMERCR